MRRASTGLCILRAETVATADVAEFTLLYRRVSLSKNVSCVFHHSI